MKRQAHNVWGNRCLCWSQPTLAISHTGIGLHLGHIYVTVSLDDSLASQRAGISYVVYAVVFLRGG